MFVFSFVMKLLVRRRHEFVYIKTNYFMAICTCFVFKPFFPGLGLFVFQLVPNKTYVLFIIEEKNEVGPIQIHTRNSSSKIAYTM